MSSTASDTWREWAVAAAAVALVASEEVAVEAAWAREEAEEQGLAVPGEQLRT